MSQQTEVVRTGVDSLIDLLEKYKTVSIEKAARILKQKESVIQSWVDFLLEDKIIGIEYKFVTPYIYLIKDGDTVNFAHIKEDFFAKAQERNLPDFRIQELWASYVHEHISSIKEIFIKKAMLRGIHSSKIDLLWRQYEEKLLEDTSNNGH